jgi:hypothetical protein
MTPGLRSAARARFPMDAMLCGEDVLASDGRFRTIVPLRLRLYSALAQKFADIFARFTSGSTAEERATGERMMDAWLKRNGKTRIDIPSVLAQAVADDEAASPPPPPSDPRDSDPTGPIITPLDLVHALLQDYIALDKYEYVAMALWAVPRMPMIVS